MLKIGCIFVVLFMNGAVAYAGAEDAINVTIDKVDLNADGTCNGDVRVYTSDDNYSGSSCEGAYLDISDTTSTSESKALIAILGAHLTGSTVTIRVDNSSALKNTCLGTNICKIQYIQMK